MVKPLCFQCRGHGFDAWLGNYDPTRHAAWPNKNNQTDAMPGVQVGDSRKARNTQFRVSEEGSWGGDRSQQVGCEEQSMWQGDSVVTAGGW